MFITEKAMVVVCLVFNFVAFTLGDILGKY